MTHNSEMIIHFTKVLKNNFGPYFHFLQTIIFQKQVHEVWPGGALTKKGGMGMCGPEDPLFTPLLLFARVPFQAKVSVQKTPFWENLEILAFTALIFAQLLALKPPNLEIFSSEASKFGNFSFTSPQFGYFQFTSPFPVEANISSQAHTLEIRAAHPYLEKSWVPPPRSFGHPNVRAVISLSSNYCARKGVIKEHRTVFFFFFFTESLWKKKKKKKKLATMQCSCCLSSKINPQRVLWNSIQSWMEAWWTALRVNEFQKIIINSIFFLNI